MTEIVQLHALSTDGTKPKLHDVPAMLRQLADEIEAGDPPGVRNAAVILDGEHQNTTIYGFGPDAGDGFRIVGMMEFAKHGMMRGGEE